MVTTKVPKTWIKGKDIEIPDILFRTLKTGHHDFDDVLSEMGGIVPSQVILATGKPGAGKTTVFIAALARLAMRYRERPAAFVSYEMSDYQLKMQTKKIPGFEDVLIKTDFTTLEELFIEFELMDPSLVVIDSLQTLAEKIREKEPKLSFNAAQKKIVHEAVIFSKRTFIPIVLIGHLTKSGTYLGPPALEHGVDTHFKVEYDRELECRTYSTSKNRFGGVIDPQTFGITSQGVWFGSPYAMDKFIDEDNTVFSSAEDDKVDLLTLTKEKISILRKEQEGRAVMPKSQVVDTVKVMIDYFKEAKAVELSQRGKGVKDSRLVKTHFGGSGVAHCNAMKGELRFKEVFFSPSFEVGKIGYGREQKFINRWCKDRVDLMTWCIMHEWCHLYAGHTKHTIDFFKEIERMANEFSVLFTETR
jgi:hypothetical protein